MGCYIYLKYKSLDIVIIYNHGKILILPSTDVNTFAKVVQQQNINLKDIVGANVIETSTIIVYSYSIVKHKRTAKCTELGKCDNADNANKLCQAIKVVASIPLKQRNMIVVINPNLEKG